MSVNRTIPPSDHPEPFPHGRHRKRRPWVVSLLVVLGIFLLLAVVAGGFVMTLATAFNQKSKQIENPFPQESTRPIQVAGDTSLNLLVMGSDQGGEKRDDEDLRGTADVGRADMLALVHIPANREHFYIMSIMRDTWTVIPGHGEHKINAALALGGPSLVVETVENLFDTRINHVVMIDFEGFRAITDALGGVEIDNPVAFTSRHSPQYFPVGVQKVNGDSALAFIRERYSFADGDYTRVRNQQLFLKALLATPSTTEMLTNPARTIGIVNQFVPYLSVDSGLDAVAVGSLALELRNVPTENVRFFTLPTLGTGTSAGGQSIVLKDPEAIGRISAAIQTDTMDELVDALALGR